MLSENQSIENRINNEAQENNKKKLEQIKEAAHSDKIDRENIISSRQEEVFRNKKYQTKETKSSESENKPLQTKNFSTHKPERQTLNSVIDANREDTGKRTNTKKQRADLKKQLSLGKVNTRRQTGKMTIQQAYEDEERQRSLASIRRAREKEKKSLEEKTTVDLNNKPIVREVKIPEFITVQDLANRMAARVAEVIKGFDKK